MKSHEAPATQAPRPRPGLILLPLDDEMVVFCEADQRLISLNATAAWALLELQRGTPASALPALLVSQKHAPPEKAPQWVQTAFDILGSQGLLEGQGPTQLPSAPQPVENRLLELRVSKMPPYEPEQGLIERRYRLLETRALIRFGHPAQERLVDSVIGHLACDDSSEPTVIVEIQALPSEGGQHLRSRIYRDGVAINSVPRLSQLAPFVKAAIWQTAVNNHDFQLYIHAGVVGTGKACILLPAAAGSGKSSLTAALTHSGYHYFSDEVALVDRKTFQVAPMPLAICTKSTGWDVMRRYYPDLLTLPTHRRDDGKMVRYIPPPPEGAQGRPAPVSHIIFPRYQAGALTELRPIGRSETLGRLMVECIAVRERFNPANVQELIEWIAHIDCYALTFSSLDEAVARVKEVAPMDDRTQ